MKNRTIHSLLISIVLLISGVSIYAQIPGAEKSQNETVKIGWYESAMFQVGNSYSQKKSGYCYDYLQKVSDYTAWNYKYIYGNWTELYHKLLSGEIDFLAGVSYSDDRSGLMLFPDYAMGTDQYYLFKHADDKSISAGDFSSFQGKKVGGITENRMTLFAEQWIKNNNLDMTIIYYDSFEKEQKAFENGEIDLFIQTLNNVTNTPDIAFEVKVGEEPFYLAVNKNRPDLLAKLNASLNSMLSIDPFVLQNLQYSNYGASLTNRTMSSFEMDYIDTVSKIKVGYLDDYIPYCDKDQEGNPTGLMTDVLKAITDNLGLRGSIDFEYKPYANYQQMILELKDEKIDVAFPVYGDLWDLEQSGINASAPVVEASESFVYKGNYDKDLITKIAINRNNDMQEAYAKRNFSKACMIYYDSMDDCLKSVQKGDTDGTVINSLRTELITGNSKYNGLSYLPLKSGVKRCFGVNTNNTALLLLLNRGLRITGKSFGMESSYKYLGKFYIYTFEDFLRDNFIWISLALVGIVAVIIILLISAMHRKEKRSKERDRYTQKLKEKQISLESVNRFLFRQNNVIKSLAHQFTALYYIDMRDYKFAEVSSLFGEVTGLIGVAGDARTAFYQFCHELASSEYTDIMTEFCDLDTINERLEGKNWISHELKCTKYGWTEAYFFAADRDTDSSLIHLVFGTRDINERKQIELGYQHSLEIAKENAEAANNAKSSFLFNMSHEIRTPINAILGFRELLENNQENPEKRQDYLNKIKISSTVLLSIIDNVLEMARIEKGTISLTEVPWSIERFSDTVYTIFSEMMIQKKITFTRQMNVQHYYFYCDPSKLREIFVNIISNAYKYTNAGGSVNVSFEEFPCEKEGYVYYQTTVSDTGIGISEEFMPHLFEEFAREKNTTETKIEGTGLGMSIVHRLVTLMGGKIDVSSKEGEGTTFVVTIPHKIADKEEMEPQEKFAVNPEDFEGKRILLAEDNAFNAEISIEILEEAGFKVEHAENGKIVLDKLNAAPDDYYSLILMDISMPVMNGYESAKAIRAMENKTKANIPIIALTANAFSEDRNEALKAGMNSHVAKPVNLSQLITEISKLIK